MSLVVAHPVPLVGEALRDEVGDALHEDVHACTSTAALLSLTSTGDVDLGVVDESLLGDRAGALFAALAALDTGVLVLSGSREGVVDLLAAGARGVVDASDGIRGVVAAVDAVRAGLTHLPPHLLSSVLLDLIVERRVSSERTAVTDPSAGDAPAAQRLSQREREVLELLCRGGDQVDISSELQIAPSTAKTYIARIMAKLGARSRVEAVQIAVRTGLVSTDQEATA